MLRAAAGVTAPMLILLAAGRYRLDPARITTDLAAFHAALDQARHAAADQARLAACRKRPRCTAAPLAEGAGYEWAEPYAETARRRVLDAWTRIAEILEPATPTRPWLRWNPRSATTPTTSTSTRGSCGCRPPRAAPTPSAGP